MTPDRPATPELVLVAAVADNDVIGRDNALPWHLPADLAHFKALTLDRPIVMGRRTWESLPGLLPRRRHLVLTHDRHYRAEGAEVVHSLDAAIAAAGAVEQLMIVGGARVYAEALARAGRIQLTRVHAEVAGDARFPTLDPAQWREVARHERPADARNRHAMSFVELERVAD
ncbi:dihydrofolate reductase [Marichromatium gracile]|uniref:Dihydrofolate reductase n=1 Tax=Marichromatium gracile TaxID=1048 RepID=A0A4R4AL14_MARGR|nr:MULTISPECIES: dihydrofolate reductase [Marichromatium]MBO8087022.1 dihydrofolate reductase [Marichromatium sp.]MBK1710306.1 dihydrofolate reductase [Marichromatium gracile]MCF1183151.1 dihydrofolate reductase [Marichromatium gracile]RNE90912.1 dihydrofolate reductase [Marichromatium sp. AB32]TCW40117.1 dihydrofolate reductase [Marichromatium gracile]